MTRNQLEYWKNVETERHNRALEEQGLAGLAIQRQQVSLSERNIGEAERSNRAKELETFRSNLAREANEIARNAETARANQANEAIRRSELSETITHNRNMETIQSNNNPWTTFATTLAGLIGGDQSSGSPNPISTAAGTVAGKAFAATKSGVLGARGAVDSFVGTALKQATPQPAIKNGVKQLPNLSSYTKQSSAKSSSKRNTTTVNSNNPVKSTTVGRTQTLVTKRYSR